jgi:hypothetical protein
MKLFKFKDEYYGLDKESIFGVFGDEYTILIRSNKSDGEPEKVVVPKDTFEKEFIPIDFKWPPKLYNKTYNDSIEFLNLTDDPLIAEYGMPGDKGNWCVDVDTNFISYHFYDHLNKRQWFDIDNKAPCNLSINK